MTHIIETANKIILMNKELDRMRLEIKPRAQRKAEAVANYDKMLAITIIKLRNGIEMEFEGEIISNPPTTIMEKIAKGIVWKDRLELDSAESGYKSLITNIDAIKSELNGWQSINKHLE